MEHLEPRQLLTAQPLQADAALVQHVVQEDYGQWQVGEEAFNGFDNADTFRTRLSGDFNADGIPDLLGLTTGGQWWLQLNDGTQLFGVPWGDTPPATADVIDTADFDGDGWLDVLSRDMATGELLLSRNSPDGFQVERWGQWTTQVAWSNLTVGDFDNDGRPDVVANEPGGNWWLAKNHGAGFHNYHWGRFQDHNWQDVVSGDFDGDTYKDMAARGQDNTWWVWQGGANGFASPEYFGHWKMQSRWQDVAAADFNGDGRDDLIGRTDDGRLWVGSATPDARFHTWTWATGWIDRAEWSNIKVVDIDADGLPDQVGRANDNTVWVARNTGERLQNYFFGRTQPNADFVDYVPGFQRQEASDVSGFFPLAVRQQPERPKHDSALRVSLNDQNQFVLHGEQLALAGVDFLSHSESLFPVPNNSPVPFDALLSNTHHQITYGNIARNVMLDGSLQLTAGWDATDPEATLEVNYGAARSGSTPVAAVLDFPVAEYKPFVPLSVDHGHDNVRQYRDATRRLERMQRQDEQGTEPNDRPPEERPVRTDLIKVWLNASNEFVLQTQPSSNLFDLSIVSPNEQLTPLVSRPAGFGVIANWPGEVRLGRWKDAVLEHPIPLGIYWPAHQSTEDVTILVGSNLLDRVSLPLSAAP